MNLFIYMKQKNCIAKFAKNLEARLLRHHHLDEERPFYYALSLSYVLTFTLVLQTILLLQNYIFFFFFFSLLCFRLFSCVYAC